MSKPVSGEEKLRLANVQLRTSIRDALEEWVAANEHGQSGDWIVVSEVDTIWMAVTSRDDAEHVRDRALWARERIDALLKVLPQ